MESSSPLAPSSWNPRIDLDEESHASIAQDGDGGGEVPEKSQQSDHKETDKVQVNCQITKK